MPDSPSQVPGRFGKFAKQKARHGLGRHWHIKEQVSGMVTDLALMIGQSNKDRIAHCLPELLSSEDNKDLSVFVQNCQSPCTGRKPISKLLRSGAASP